MGGVSCNTGRGELTVGGVSCNTGSGELKQWEG